MFKVVVKNKFFKNAEKIHPLAQRSVSEIINVVSKLPEVEKVIVFGSSACERCRPSSDLDIAVQYSFKAFDSFGDPTEKCAQVNRQIRLGTSQKAIDIVDLDNPQFDSLFDDINKLGVVVYG